MENSKKRKGYSQSLSLPIASLSIVRQRSCGGTRSVYICTHLIDIMVDDATDTPDTRCHGPGVHFRCTHPYHRHTTICTIFPQFRVQRGIAKGFKAARQFPCLFVLQHFFFIKKEDAVNLLGIDFIKRLLLNERLLFQISKTQLTLEASATLQVHFTRGTPRATRAVANHTFETSGGEFVVCGHSGRWWFGVYTSLFVGFQKLGV